ncbi:hypothetical protein SEA_REDWATTLEHOG_116 [Gordonia phage RedWattleHog]|uniref:Uncharacterized protein n=1 Tax=Gordonia phage Stormageddon TaxID=2656541 RepID=A0A649VSK0_9CAUD|nr:hypothetical protein KHQ86_gp185 [Gordonia phage Stormageddon]QGJ94975.1 hypothetical protein SEA_STORMAGEDDON_115 [Gordonia phage Stormageddon]QLF83619.1 hypothetical protein SEA_REDWATTLEHOG_116 [Gordonia phage RedWattleHog]
MKVYYRFSVPPDALSPPLEVDAERVPRVGDQIEFDLDTYDVHSVTWADLELTSATVVLR